MTSYDGKGFIPMVLFGIALAFALLSSISSFKYGSTKKSIMITSLLMVLSGISIVGAIILMVPFINVWQLISCFLPIIVLAVGFYYFSQIISIRWIEWLIKRKR